MLTFDVEPYSMVIPEMKAIYPEHWEELAFDKDIIELDPDYEAYNKMDKAGLIHVVTARFNNELVGYFIFCINFALHYKRSLTAHYDIFYLRKKYRKGRNGIDFIRFAEQSLIEKNVQKIYTGVKLPHDFGLVFERLGYRPTERIYTKILTP